MNPEGVRLGGAGGSPDFAKKLRVGDDLAAMAEEEAQELVFPGGEGDGRAGAGDPAGGKVDLDVAETGDRGLRGARGGRAAKQDAQAGEQLAAAEGLGEVIVGAGVEGGDFLRFLVADGKDEDGKRGPLAEAAEDLKAVGVGQPEVEDDGIRPQDGSLVQAEGGGGGLAYAVAGAFEGEAKEAADLHLVVDD